MEVVLGSSKPSGTAMEGRHNDLLYALYLYVEPWVWNAYAAHTDACLCIVSLFAEVADQLIVLHCTDEANMSWNSRMHLYSDTTLIDFVLSSVSHCHRFTWPYISLTLTYTLWQHTFLPCCTTKTHVVQTQKFSGLSLELPWAFLSSLQVEWIWLHQRRTASSKSKWKRGWCGNSLLSLEWFLDV